MRLTKYDRINRVSIWEPRWHDQHVLIAVRKIGEHNVVSFTKAPSITDEYYISGKNARKYPITTNGKIRVYDIPLDDMELYEGRVDG